MSQQQPSGWNNFFHRDQGYDTTYNNNNNTQAMQEPTRLSFFSYKQEQGYNNNGETREVISDVEKVPHKNPGDPSFWKSPGNEAGAKVVMPSAPPESPRGTTTTFEREKGVESDEELARRLYKEDQEQHMRYSQGSTKPPGGVAEFQRPGEAESYYAAVGNGGGRRDSSNVQVGMGAQLPSNTTGPRLQKAYLDPDLLLAKKRSWKRPYFTYIVTLLQLAVLIYEFIYNKQETGSAIQVNPFNILIGPNASPTLIQLGARFVPCMKPVPMFDNNTPILCSTDPTKDVTCTVEQLCGFGGFKGDKPNQWFRFITPIFLHGGIVHFLFNMVFQVQTGKQIEIDIGWFRYSLIYMASGIFGFIFGGNFSDATTPSVGASGSLFGIVGILFLDLFQNWKIIRNPCFELTKMLIMIIITFAIGLLPAIDNFSHIGGFVMGVVMGLVLIPTKNYKKITWILRIVAIPIAALLFFLLIRNFYVEDPTKTCTWCKYLDCLPVYDWCDTTGLKNVTINNP
ncbi:8634_t:CDS:1 [Funneliformis geosporum]|uniref:Rhomboid-type serine protease n=1 Tax=Funneliformis geosporum TaxID=1117311 RepID=A0A9W4SGU7_9GLOM|nr:8634_t:CDS:1 [Funneliformis geosporum]CAI2169070.1 4331_t:CDS:1 [Funneliformis geosporum]